METKCSDQSNIPETIAVHPQLVNKQEGNMTALAARFFRKASAESVSEIETLVSLALFCGVGLLVSLSVLLLDKYILGEWL